MIHHINKEYFKLWIRQARGIYQKLCQTTTKRETSRQAPLKYFSSGGLRMVLERSAAEIENPRSSEHGGWVPQEIFNLQH